jgi:Glycosyl hydrolase family 79 C-terminal beta domain
MMRASRAASGFLTVTVLAVAAAGGAHVISSARHSGATPAKATVTVSSAVLGRTVPGGFVGISMGPRDIIRYNGPNPRAPNPVFEQLLRNLAPGQWVSLRIGGDGTDWSWWPVPHMVRPPGAKFPLTKSWLGLTRAVAQAVGARLILGINFEADSRRVAAAEAQATLGGIGRRWIEAFELGNEPELYGSFGWYKAPDGQHVLGRPRGYDFAGFLRDFANIAGALPRVPLAGPTTGAPAWMQQLGHFLSAERRVGVVTMHSYPLKRCTSGANVTIGELLSNSSSTGLANSVASYVRVAHAHHVPLRIDELNGVSCGGERGVSDTFASALWALDTLFEMARVGVDGVNFHTVPLAMNELFSGDYSKGRWHSFVHPQYYGLMMFAQAAPAGSRLLRISGAPGAGLHAWATRAPNGQVRVVLINEASRRSWLVRVRIPSGHGTATLERLEAPSIGAKSGVSLAGQSFGRSTYTGVLAGSPSTTTVAPSRDVYAVKVPAASAAMLTLPAG